MESEFYILLARIAETQERMAEALEWIVKEGLPVQKKVKKYVPNVRRGRIIDNSLAKQTAQALVKIHDDENLRKAMMRWTAPNGDFIVRVGDVTKVVNENSNKPAVFPHMIGKVLRDGLQLKMTERRHEGYWVYWDEKVRAMAEEG